MNSFWKKTLMISLDVALAGYLVLAVTSFNCPDRSEETCSKVNITIADKDSSGFLNASEVKDMLVKKHLYPAGMKMSLVDLRSMEGTLKGNSFISSAEVSHTQNGTINIEVTQILPLLRVKSASGEDYYIGLEGNIMRGGQYSSDLIVATGNISQWYAQNYITLVGQWLQKHKLWEDQVEQINILPDKTMEIVPRVGNHIICLGQMPETNDKVKRQRLVETFLDKKFERLDKFYRYGLNQVGWNKYYYISLEFDNQIICRKPKSKADKALASAEPAEKKEGDKPKNEDKPKKDGDKPQKVGDKPQKPQNNGDKPKSNGDKPKSNGDKPKSNGDKPKK